MRRKLRRGLAQADMAQVLNTNVIGPALLTKALYEPLKAASKPAAIRHSRHSCGPRAYPA